MEVLTFGSMSGRIIPSASRSASNASMYSADTDSPLRPAARAFRMILSSTSVWLRT